MENNHLSESNGVHPQIIQSLDHFSIKTKKKTNHLKPMRIWRSPILGNPHSDLSRAKKLQPHVMGNSMEFMGDRGRYTQHYEMGLPLIFNGLV